MPYARPFTFTSSTGPQYSESVGLVGGQFFISAPDSGIFATYGSLSNYQWWNGPNEGPGYIIGTFVDTFDHTTPDGFVGNAKFWRTKSLTSTDFVSLGNGILGSNFTSDKDVWNSLSAGSDPRYWTSYQYSVFLGGVFENYLNKNNTSFAVIRKTDGQLDPHVGGSYGFFEPGFGGVVLDIYHRSNGKMLVGGSFTQSIGTTQSTLVQIGNDGLIDGIIRGFGSNSEVLQSVANPHRGWSLGSAGGSQIDIVSVGNFQIYDSQSAKNIVAINTDGSKNSQFGNGFNDLATCIDVDFKNFYVGGFFSQYDGNSCSYLAAISTFTGLLVVDIGGSISLDNYVESIRLSKDELYLGICGGFTTPKAGFVLYDVTNDIVAGAFSDFDSPAMCVDFQSNGSIIVGGLFTQYGSNSCNKICKLDPTGGFDTTFGTNIGNGFDGNVLDLRVLHDDSIIVVGDFTDFDGNTANRIVKLDSNGNLIIDWNDTISTGADGAIQCVAPR